MYAGLYGGMAIGTLILGFIAQFFGYKYAFLTISLLIFLIMILPIFIKEIKIEKKQPKIVSVLIIEFKKKKTQLVAFFAPLSAISAGFILLGVPLFMKTILKLNVAQIGMITSIYPIAIVIGSLVGGTIADMWDRKNSLYIFIGASVVFSASLILVNSLLVLVVIYSIIGFLQGGYIVGTCTICMDITNPRVGATQFSILTSLFNFGEVGGSTIAGPLITLLGFNRFFLYSAWIFGPALLILYFINLKKCNIK
jgi:predicted MFS family arabinose efflux permease